MGRRTSILTTRGTDPKHTDFRKTGARPERAQLVWRGLLRSPEAACPLGRPEACSHVRNRARAAHEQHLPFLFLLLPAFCLVGVKFGFLKQKNSS